MPPDADVCTAKAYLQNLFFPPFSGANANEQNQAIGPSQKPRYYDRRGSCSCQGIADDRARYWRLSGPHVELVSGGFEGL